VSGDAVVLRDRESILDQLDAVSWVHRVNNRIDNEKSGDWKLDSKVGHIVLHVLFGGSDLLLVREN
tara:strand:- start:520 stop:717 length:198 start_codon:yes stop_codon:yes gene_type:complete